MKINLGDLQGESGSRCYQETLSDLGLEALGDSGTAVVINLDLREQGEDLFLSGKVRTTLTLSCDRCLVAAQLPVEGNLALWLLAAERPELDPEEQDLIILAPGQREVDISGLLIDSIKLAIPPKVLCRTDCRGLCPNCGADLNQGQCGCDNMEIDDRWSALVEIRQELEGN
ncbi:MAG: DUF177 domain-containing protein [Candidatus Marinimicrobia bacterium]|nr:DUF177 domain-containing protein [Candidatus Neomarinimicrobiota bacterium]